MKTLVLLILMALPAWAEGPIYTHKDKTTSLEFDNVYKDLRSRNSYLTSNTSGQFLVGQGSGKNPVWQSEISTFTVTSSATFNTGLRASTITIKNNGLSLVPSTSGDDLVIDNSSIVGMSLIGNSAQSSNIFFGDNADTDVGSIRYEHSADVFDIYAGAQWAVRIEASRVHIDPNGSADVQLEVSDGATTGGGAIHRASSGTHSRRDIKSDIRYFDQAKLDQGLSDVLTLRPVEFRYKRRLPNGILVRDPSLPMRKGLILEDSPASIKDGDAVILDNRVLNLEMAVQSLHATIEELKARIETLESR